jgi:D-3-phosphoglycerate dehydrogenase / 2-oxoglutarate reductase
MKELKVLIVDPVHEMLILGLKKRGFLVDYLPDIDYDQCTQIIHDYEILVIRTSFKVDSSLISKAVRLKSIARAGAGLDNIDVDAASKQQIMLLNAPEGNANAVAEHVTAFLFAYYNNIIKANQEVKSWVWDREGNRGEELLYKTIGIIGYGNMGKAVADKLRPLVKEVLIYDKYIPEYGSDDQLNQIFESTDVLSLHVPLTIETKQQYNASFFEKFKKNIVLVNTSRGEVVELNNLIQQLKIGRVKAALLDVLPKENFKTLLEEEKIKYQEIFTMPNVILSPHGQKNPIKKYLRCSWIKL